MSDKEARAMAAGRNFKIGGKEYKLRPVVVQQLCDLEQEALQFYRRQVLQTYSSNKDLLGDMADLLLAKKFEEVSQLSLDDIPKKMAYDTSKLPVTPAARAWAKGFLKDVGTGDEKTEPDDGRVLVLLAVALDQEQVTSAEVEEMTKQKPIQAKVRYDQWWITGCFQGKVSFIHSSLKKEHPELTREDVGQWPLASIFEASRMVEDITTPDLGNG